MNTILPFIKKNYNIKKQPAGVVNASTEVMYLEYMLNVAISRFKWKGLPPEMEGKGWYIEKSLAKYGCVILFKEPDTDRLIMLRASGLGELDLWGEYNQYQAFSENGHTWIVDAKDCVVFWDNPLHTATTILMLNNFASRVAEIQRTCDVRLNNHKAPIILSGGQKLMASLRSLWARINNNEACILTDETGFGESLVKNVLNNDVTFLNRELHFYKKDLFGEFWNMMGVNFNPSQDKKERVVVDEIQSNNEQVMQSRNIYLQERLRSCKKANKKFNIDMSCEYIIDNIDLKGKIDEGGNNNDLRDELL